MFIASSCWYCICLPSHSLPSLNSEQFKRPTDELELDQTVASRVHSLKEERIVATPHAEHEVLRQSHTYTGATDEHVKAEATISEIERIQWEMADLFESIYQHEIPASGE